MNSDEIDAGLAPTANYQYAQKVGAQLFVAGQVPHDSVGNLVGIGDRPAQARQCLQNLRTLITLHGFCKTDIRKLTVYVVGNPQDLADTWQIVTAWFEDNVPPATLLGVAALGYENQLVEIDATIIQTAEN
ncbi:Endoribonuclease L-PSP [[Leptolyngbya] sp. PCC 7376]|uniref:RidA family protein n=1 Tax=[Leptolyngbya] sp. PCC 7376 TaxID=111781 RepID=UPI00029F396F|nr:RidA family protein [[Leptolyngbya] sp. PCC 7376]AFY40686.1 Endoribonuclease L-PSP [[Leptolyngbya] sp. PCC 7376]